MKYSLECNVNGNVVIGKQITVTKGSKDFVLIPDGKGKLSSIKIITKAPRPNKFRSRIEPGEGKAAAKIIIDGDRELYEELIREFQQLESVLSFDTSGSLRNIAWDAAKEEVIPETDEEKAQVSVSGFHFTKEYRDDPVYLDERSFDSIIQSKDRYVPLIIPEAFFREGINEFHSRRYINAFYNFYFILEDLYGQGKTRNKNISDAFKNSTEFRGFIEWVMKEHIGNHNRHRTNIQSYCTEEKVTYNVDGLIELLQKVRGNLHHYSSRSSKHLGNPFSHEDFESIAFLTMGVAVKAILQKILMINQSMGIGKSEN